MLCQSCSRSPTSVRILKQARAADQLLKKGSSVMEVILLIHRASLGNALQCLNTLRILLLERIARSSIF